MIESINTLDEILEPYAGQTVWCESDKTVYRWDPVEGWQECNAEGNITMSAYDMNKQIIGQLQILDKEVLKEKKEIVKQYVDTDKGVYYMLLCRDVNYYTLFARQDTNPELLEDILIDECLPQIGQIKAIDLTEDGAAIEIWLQDAENNVYVAYFFAYDAGVIVCS